jgi:hypothetical protein
MIDFFKLKFDYLRNASNLKLYYQNAGVTRGAQAAQALALRERLRCASDIHKLFRRGGSIIKAR